MIKRIGITVRITSATAHVELRDSLAHDWQNYLHRTFHDVAWMMIPNLGSDVARYLSQWNLDALILSGGDDIGDHSKRDETEFSALEWAMTQQKPVLGVCRGLQIIQTHFGGALHRTDDTIHRAKNHSVTRCDSLYAESIPLPAQVNSYHRWGVHQDQLAAPLRPFLLSSDHVVEGLYHPTLPILGIQWHPEREMPERDSDHALIVAHLKGTDLCKH